MKSCIYCGAPLPDEANFCPNCGKTQAEASPEKAPRPWRRRLGFALTVLAVILATLLIVRLRHAPVVYDDGGPEVLYSDSDGSVKVFLTWVGSPDTQSQAVRDKTSKLGEGMDSVQPSMLYVYDPVTNTNLQEAFLTKVAFAEIAVTRQDGEAVSLTAPNPSYNENFKLAAMESDIMYTADSGANDIAWILHMKNGDTIVLHQTFTVIRLLERVYTPEEVPLDTAEDLRALLQQVWEIDGSNSITTIYLPPVTYEGEFSFDGRSYNLIGTSDGDRHTTFTGTISVNSQDPQISGLEDLVLEGDGSGVGISATQSLYLEDCVLRGWDIAAYARQGAWIGIFTSTVENNRVGLQFDSTSSRARISTYEGNVFRNNDTAVLLIRVPGTYPLPFPNTVFSGHRIDIDNPAGHPVETDSAG